MHTLGWTSRISGRLIQPEMVSVNDEPGWPSGGRLLGRRLNFRLSEGSEKELKELKKKREGAQRAQIKRGTSENENR